MILEDFAALKSFDSKFNNSNMMELLAIQQEYLDLLHEHFGDRVISCCRNFPYSAHSLYLTAPDAYVWDMLKKPFSKKNLLATID